MFHHQRALTQFTPARAKKKVEITDLSLAHSSMWIEEKIDGERYLIHSNVGGSYRNACTSRRESVTTGRFVEKTDRVPRLMEINLPSGSLFDCEFVSSGDEVKLDLPGKFWDKLDAPWHLDYLPCYPHVANTVSIMGSLAEEAIRKQEERGYIHAYCFDIVTYDGKSLGHNSQLKRRNFLKKIIEAIDPATGLILMPAFVGLSVSEIEELFYLVTDIEGEGLVLKDPAKPYNHASAWTKLKIDYPADVVLTGNYEMGKEGATGKMLGFVGTLEIGVYHNNELKSIGWVSAIMDSEANLPQLTCDALNGSIRGRVIEIRHNGLQVKSDAPLKYTLRHPRSRRDRDDKNATDCTWEILKAEASKKLG